MIELRRLTEDGINVFRAWLAAGSQGAPPPQLRDGALCTEVAMDVMIDETIPFSSRYEFGLYLKKQFKDLDSRELMGVQNDGLWAWLAVIYFNQLSPGKPRESWHYIVTRMAALGSLAYRHAVRTSYELVLTHGQNALVCLGVPMKTWGEMAEQLASRQTLAHNHGFFQTAYDLYVRDGKLSRGASSKPKKPKDRKPGNRTGFGGARRLAIALQRLDLTFDTEIMESTSLIPVLPKEFSKWAVA